MTSILYDRQRLLARVVSPILVLCFVIPCAADDPMTDRFDPRDPGPTGEIRGVVQFAGTRRPVVEAEVVLRVGLEGRLVPAAVTRTDQQGQFSFPDLPATGDLLFVPGANYQEVHYPGPRTVLAPDRRVARIVINVAPVLAGPSPLVIRRQDVEIRRKGDYLHVTELLVIDNPQPATYMGPPPTADQPAITLALALPAGFQNVTFDKEFFGRRFTLTSNQLATDIPWTQGSRELRFSYVLPARTAGPIWQRPLDLPCLALRVRVITDRPESVRWNVSGSSVSRTGPGRVVLSRTAGDALPRETLVAVWADRMGPSVMVYAPWAATGLLVTFCASSMFLVLRRRVHG